MYQSLGMPNTVARLTSIRLVLALATLNRWEIHHLDVCTAFLNPY